MQRHSKSVVVTFTHFAWRWWNHYEGVIRYAKEKKLVLVAMVAWWEIANMSSQFANAANRPEYLHNKFTCLVSWLANFWPGTFHWVKGRKDHCHFKFIDFSSCLFHEWGCILSAWTFIVYRPSCLIPIMISCV